MFCGNCGNQVPEGANVCPNCGTPLAGAPVQQAAPQADVNFTQAAPQPDAAYTQAAPQPEVNYGQAAPQPDAAYTQAAPQPDMNYSQAAPQPGAVYGQAAPQPGMNYAQPVPQSDANTTIARSEHSRRYSVRCHSCSYFRCTWCSSSCTGYQHQQDFPGKEGECSAYLRHYRSCIRCCICSRLQHLRLCIRRIYLLWLCGRQLQGFQRYFQRNRGYPEYAGKLRLQRLGLLIPVSYFTTGKRVAGASESPAII